MCIELNSGENDMCSHAHSQLFVWKEVDYGGMSEREKQLLVQEVNLLRELRHPHIVRYHDRIIDRVHSTLYIVMEYCEVSESVHTRTCICSYQYITYTVLHVLHVPSSLSRLYVQYLYMYASVHVHVQ